MTASQVKSFAQSPFLSAPASSSVLLQIPEVLFTLVNLSRLNLAGTMLGPEQGRQLDERLRLDTLAVNASAGASLAADNAPMPDDPTTRSAQPTPQQEGQQQQQQQQRELDNASRNGSGGEPGRKCISRPTSVPDHRLPEIRDKVRTYIRRKSHAATMRGCNSEGAQLQRARPVAPLCGLATRNAAAFLIN